MIYEVRATMFFNEEDEANDFMHDCFSALPKAIVVKPGETDQQCSEADFIECRHDTNPNEPCTLVQHIDNCPVPPEPAPG